MRLPRVWAVQWCPACPMASSRVQWSPILSDRRPVSVRSESDDRFSRGEADSSQFRPFQWRPVAPSASGAPHRCRVASSERAATRPTLRPNRDHGVTTTRLHSIPRRVHNRHHAWSTPVTTLRPQSLPRGDQDLTHATSLPGSAGGPPAPPIDVQPGSPDRAGSARVADESSSAADTRDPRCLVSFQHLGISAFRYFAARPTAPVLLTTR